MVGSKAPLHWPVHQEGASPPAEEHSRTRMLPGKPSVPGHSMDPHNRAQLPFSHREAVSLRDPGRSHGEARVMPLSDSQLWQLSVTCWAGSLWLPNLGSWWPRGSLEAGQVELLP